MRAFRFDDERIFQGPDSFSRFIRKRWPLFPAPTFGRCFSFSCWSCWGWTRLWVAESTVIWGIKRVLQMGGLECVITGLMDEYTAFFKSWKHSREIFTLGVIIVSFSVALINVTPVRTSLFIRTLSLENISGGNLHLQSVWYLFCWNLAFVFCSLRSHRCLLVLRFGQIHPRRRSHDRLQTWTVLEDLLEIHQPDFHNCRSHTILPNSTSKIVWFQMVVLFGLLNPQPLKYNDYFYPKWAEWVGWSLALSSIVMIPLVAVIQLVKTKGTFKEVSHTTRFFCRSLVVSESRHQYHSCWRTRRDSADQARE